MQALVKLSFPVNRLSEAIIAIITTENPSTTQKVVGDHINLSGSGFRIKITEIAKALNLKGKPVVVCEAMFALFQIHSRTVIHMNDTHITITPATVPEQVRLRPNTAVILADICKITGSKKVDVLHQAIRDYRLRIS